MGSFLRNRLQDCWLALVVMAIGMRLLSLVSPQRDWFSQGTVSIDMGAVVYKAGHSMELVLVPFVISESVTLRDYGRGSG